MLFRWKLIVLVLLCAAGSLAAGPLPENSPSGILVDRVLPMAHLEDLEGAPEGPVVDLSRWSQAVHELSRAAESPLGWPTARDLATARLDGLSRNEIPLAVLWSSYDRLGAEGQTQTARVFAFTPLRQEVYHGQSVVFSLSPESILTHKAEDLISWALDADDGQGWQEFRPGQDIPVSYSTTGGKHLRLMVELNDGRLVFGNALLQVKRLVTPEPTDTWFITASESFEGASATGLAYLYLADDHSTLTNPVVVVEGFDLDNSMDWPVLYDLLNQENLLEDLRAEGFDAVILDFTEATEPIQRNAFVLTQLLSQVQAAAGVGSSTAVVGASMGGLVSRYGLTWLENEGVDHNVRTFISFDSPQTGANIPLGLQYWVNFFREQAAEAEYLLSRLNTPAARQMLLYHYVDEPSGLPGPDPLLPAFQADLLAVGNWPAQPRLVSVANGSGLGAGQGFTAGEQLIHYEYRNALVDIDGNVWSVPENTSQVIFDGMIDPIWPLPDSYQTVTVGDTLPWDNAPGGNRGTMAQMGETEVPYGDIVALHDNHCFIPTVSALALEVTDPFFDIAGAPDLLELTPFDAVYFPAANQGHIAVTPENKVWILNEINSGMSPVPDGVPQVAKGPVLYPAAPNPFNPSTRISFRVDQDARVTLQIHDLAGRLVRTLVSDEVHESGLHAITWTGRGDAGQSMASGVYLCRLKVGDSFRSQRLTLLK